MTKPQTPKRFKRICKKPHYHKWIDFDEDNFEQIGQVVVTPLLNIVMLPALLILAPFFYLYWLIFVWDCEYLEVKE